MVLSPDYIISELINAMKEQALLTAFYNGQGKLITQETKGLNEKYLYQEYLCLEAKVWILTTIAFQTSLLRCVLRWGSQRAY